jgi:electron transfer flavoprotein alpha subunit
LLRKYSKEAVMAKEILCIIEIDENKIKKSSLEVLSAAKKIKELEGDGLISAVVLAEEPQNYSAELFAHGADKVYGGKSSAFKYYRTQPFVKTVANLINSNHEINYVLVPGTGNGRDFAPYLGAKLKAGVIADVIDVEKADGGLHFIRPCFAGNLLYWGKFVGDGVKILSVRPKAFPVPEKSEKTGEYIELSVDVKEEEIPVRVLEVMKETGKINLQDADFIVSAGRGIGGPDNLKIIQELADTLGGAVGASRAVVDSGWISYDHQVGQTGKTVKPKIYIACGISGAIQHLAGMRTSDIIVAINKDPEAPIFKVATYGIVDDLFKVVPVLTSEIKKRLVK